jgi:2-hydroxy-3-oxopropionate reductase
MLDARLHKFLLAGYFKPGFKLDLMKKDIQLALDAARLEGIHVPFTTLAAEIFSAASAAGHGAEDFSRAAEFSAASAARK